MKRFKLITAVYLLLIRSNKILLQRRYNTGYEDGNYGLPAGHVEDNESMTTALCREVREEIDIKLNPKDLELVHIMHRKEEDIRVDLFFTTKRYQKKPINAEPQKCDDLQWFPLKKLPKNTIPYIVIAINNYSKNILFSERGWN